MSDFAAMHLAISDGTFIDWLQANGEYTDSRRQLYKKWKKLYKEFKTIEFELLSKRTSQSK
jgi:hypothetical protein